MKILNQLNPKQREAVLDHEGPHIVMAGPGTGKTQLLSARIMSMLISEAQIDPSMILALTYTEAGAIAMRQRLVKFIRKDAYKVAIHTFHSLCNEIIQHNPDYFGTNDLDVVSDVEVIQILKKIIDNLDPKNPLYRAKGDQYWEIDRLRNLFRLMKNEDIGINKIAEYVDDYLKFLPENPDFQYKRGNKKKLHIVDGVEKPIETGDPKVAVIDEEKIKMAKLVAGSKLVEEYNQELYNMKRYDFEDMIHWVIKAFLDAEWLKLYYQEKYQYVLVDEMQDTSGAQFSFLKLMLDFWDKPNVFAVGDLDQTLYEFSGARLRNITDFVTHYLPKDYVLTDNYRSGQKILNHAWLVVKNSPKNLPQSSSKDSSLTARKKDKDDFEPIVRIYGTVFEEEATIIHKVKTYTHEKGYQYKDIAIIYRKHRQGENIAKALASNGIPVNVKKKVNVLQEPSIKFILGILDIVAKGYIIDPLQDELAILAILMFSEYSGIKSENVAEFLLAYRKHKKTSIKDQVDFANSVQSFVIENESVRAFVTNITDIISKHSLDPVVQKVELIFTKFDIVKILAEKPDRYQQISYLHTFFSFIKTEARKKPTSFTIEDLQRTLKLMQENEIPLQTNTLIHDQDGVNLLTVHGAKGLEFKYVFLMGCTRNEWEGSRVPATTYKLPTNMMYGEENKVETNRRLFYVAITRAEKVLEVSYATHDNKERALEPSQFIEEAEFTNVKEVKPSDSIIQALIDITKPDIGFYDRISKLEDKLYQEMMENFRLSVSHTNKYLKCNRAYFYENVLRIPFVATGALIFGNAVHRALRRTYEAFRETGKILSLSTYLDFFMKDLGKNRGQITEAEYIRRLGLIPVLKKYYKDHVEGSNYIVQCEFKVNNVEIDGIPFTGDFDKLEFEGHLVDVVDYKTGKLNYTKKALKKGKDYWRQLVAYKLLLDAIYWKPWKFRSARIEMIDTEYCGPLPLDITPEDEKAVLADLHTAYDGIMAGDFSYCCNEPECKWCNL